MTLFPSPLSDGNRTTLRTSGYWTRVLSVICPNEIVFQARANETITDDPFIAFNWDNATIGAYTDVWEGMIAMISETTDLRDAKYRGRVRLAPSASEFYIDRNSTILNDGDYITVIRDADLFPRVRNDTLIDGSIVYHDLPPMISGLPQSIVLYDADNDGEVSYTPVQVGIPVDAAATVVDTWAWDASGNGTVTFDDPTLEHPAITFEAGYHYLLRVIYEDDNGESNYQMSHVYAIARTLTAPVVQPIVTGSITSDSDNGWSASLTGYGDLTGLLERTHCAVFHIEHFGDDSSTPMVSNVLMNGRIRSSSIRTEGSAEAGQLQQVSFTVEGLTAYLRRLDIPNDIVRATATPNEWGEITAPNPYRMAVYALWAYTTLTNICGLGVEDGAFEDWQIGAEPRGIDGGKALDVLTGILDTIKAAPNFAPAGGIHLARTISYQQDRSGVDLITTFTLDDMRDVNIDIDSSRTTSQVVGWGGVYATDTNTITLYTARAPSIVYGEGETRELTREILTVNSVGVDAQDELENRVSSEYAFHNAKPLMSLTLFDSYAGLLIPSNFQRWAAVIPASSNTLGNAYTASDYWQLQSVALTVNDDGSLEASGEWYAETTFSGAQIESELLPNNLSNMNPVLPMLANELAFPTDPLENYPTDLPDLDEYQPSDPFSGMQAYTPIPPDVAGQAANRQPRVNCKVLQALFSNSSNTTSSWLTVNTAPYLLTASGSAVITSDGWTQVFNFLDSDGGFVPVASEGVHTPGVGWEALFFPADCIVELVIRLTLPMSSTVTGLTMTYDAVEPSVTDGSNRLKWVRGYDGVTLVANTTENITYGTHQTVAWSGAAVSMTEVELVLTPSNLGGGCVSLDGSATATRFVISGTGSNPFTGDPGTAREADTFYSYQRNEEDAIDLATVTALGPTEGLFIDNAVYVPSNGVPPFNESHRYPNMPFTGTGNVLNARMVFNSYTDVQDVYETLELCRKL